jgi:hypothetical protein
MNGASLIALTTQKIMKDERHRSDGLLRLHRVVLDQAAEANLASSQRTMPTCLTLWEPSSKGTAKVKVGIPRPSGENDTTLTWPVDHDRLHAFSGQQEIRHLRQSIAVGKMEQRGEQHPAFKLHRCEGFRERGQRIT